jgi:8-oxo-dGTP pyrophosphatase MutT (NUDIX family)
MGAVDDRPIRRAASVLCGRNGAEGLEVLVLERGPDSRFLPGYVAFPGGAIDPSDGERALAWFGSEDEVHRAAAVRELVEEVGIAITAAGAELAAHDDLTKVTVRPPQPDALFEVCHWVAPDDVPVRFDARYFAVGLPYGIEPTADGGETADAWWVTPRSLMNGWESGERKLYWPTYLTMLHLVGCTTVAELLALRFDTREPTPQEIATLPYSVMEQA